MPNNCLKLAISPCPNDTFIFGPLILDLVEPPKGHLLETEFLDIQRLNEEALLGTYDVIKISAALVPYILDQYQILSCGAALGENCGPLLISAKWDNSRIDNSWSVLIPGNQTTANYLLKFAFPLMSNTRECLFSDIEDQLISGSCDAGVIIHESRFSYAEKGLKLIADLGLIWTTKTLCPIPLGLIAVKRSLNYNLKQAIKQQIIQSLQLAYKSPVGLEQFISQNASDLDPSVIKQHIDLYVNEYSVDLGKKGLAALEMLFSLQTSTAFNKADNLI